MYSQKNLANSGVFGKNDGNMSARKLHHQQNIQWIHVFHKGVIQSTRS